MKPVDVKSNTYIGSSKELITNTLNLKLVILLQYQNIKQLLWLKKLKILCRGHMLLMILTGKKLLELYAKGIAKNKSKIV